MDAPPGAGMLPKSMLHSPKHYHAPWQEEVDDTAITGNDGTEADMLRVLAVDEELLLEDEEEGIPPRQEVLETVKLLFSGGVAGAFSKTATAPLARLTILYQVCIAMYNTLICPFFAGSISLPKPYLSFFFFRSKVCIPEATRQLRD